MASKGGWQRKFDDPIPLPDGQQLVTLHDAGDCITSVPKKESGLPEWQAAIEAVMLVSRGGPTMLPRIGVMRALNRHHVREFNPDRKATVLIESHPDPIVFAPNDIAGQTQTIVRHN